MHSNFTRLHLKKSHHVCVGLLPQGGSTVRSAATQGCDDRVPGVSYSGSIHYVCPDCPKEGEFLMCPTAKLLGKHQDASGEGGVN